MKRFWIPGMVVLVMAAATPAHAAIFTLSSYDVIFRNHDPGLVLWETDLLAAPATFTLNTVGDSYTRQLFRVGTNEGALNTDDVVPYNIEVDFTFTSPPPGFGGTAEGLTGAGWFLQSFGYVAWDNPLVLNFGNTGQLGITLSNATFGLPGSAVISASFQLLRNDSGTASVPEPATMTLMGLGLIGAAAHFRRRRAA